jgi:hypothetical protein
VGPGWDAMGDDAATVEQLRAELAAARVREDALADQVNRRDRALAEAREQQAATGEILSLIAGSTLDAQRVLDAVAERAAAL